MDTSSGEKPSFVFWWAFWGVGLSLAIAGVLIDTAYNTFAPLGRDFANLYSAGSLALEGHAIRAFDVDVFRLAIREFTGSLTTQNYSYPPHALLIAVPFALLPYWFSLLLWTVAGAAFFMWAARKEIPFHPIYAILTPAAGLNIWNGHYGFLLGGLWLLFFRYLQNNPKRAGLIAAVLTFKPHMGLFIGIAALTKAKAVLWAIIGTLALVLISSLLFGPESWREFIANTVAAQVEILTRPTDNYYFALMPTVFVNMGRGVEGEAVQWLFIWLVFGALVYRPTLDPFTLATATFLVLPYAFSYDMTVACLGFAVLLFRDWGALNFGRRAILVGAFMVPNLVLFAPHYVPLILMAGFLVQLGRAPKYEWRGQTRGNIETNTASDSRSVPGSV